MKKAIFLSLLFIILSCSTKNKLPLEINSKTNSEATVQLRIDYQGRYALTFPSYLIIENISSNQKVVRGISFNTYSQSFYPYIYRENGENYMYPIPVLEKKEKINFRVDMLLPIDSIQTKKILDYYQIKEYPTRKNLLYLSTYKNFIGDLKKIKISKDSTLYNQLFNKIIFRIPVTNKLHDKKARILNYNWNDNKTYDEFPDSEMVDIVK